MTWNDLVLRLRALLFRSRAESELDEELRFHLEMEARKHSSAGIDSFTARRQAAMAFGAAELVKEECRDARGTRWVEDLWHDLVFGVRLLRKDRGYTVSAIAALAVGIGANAALFTLFSAVALKPLPVPDPSGLASIWRTTAQSPVGGFFSFADYVYYRDHNTVFASVAAETPSHLRLAGMPGAPAGEVAEPLIGLFVTSNYFTTFGVHPIAGRGLLPEDDGRTAGPYPVLLSANYWQRRFGGDPGVLGQTLMLSGIQATVAGISPRDFMGTRPDVPDVFISASALGDPQRAILDRTTLSRGLTGRLKPGVTLSQAQAELSVLAGSLRRDYPQAERQWSIRVEPAARFGPAHLTFTRMFVVLQIAMGFVLLIACTNVAGLLLGRAAARQREIAVRLSMGATRRRLVRQLVTEGVLIAILAGAGALAGTQQALSAIARMVSANLASQGGTIAVDVALDLHVFFYVLLISILAGVSFALTPALQSTRPDLVTALKNEFAGFGGRHKGRLRGSMIACQIAVCLALLIGAALLSSKSAQLLSVDPGFETRAVLNVNINSPAELGYSPARVRDLQARLNERLRTLPGVLSVSAANRIPLGGNISTTLVVPQIAAIPGRTDDQRQLPYAYVSVDYFKTLGIPILRGRGFLAQDFATNAPVAVISDALARRFWPGEDPIGKRIALGSPTEVHFIGRGAPLSSSTEVIGIARDVYSMSLTSPDPGAVYLPRPIDQWSGLIFMRTSGDPNVVAASVLSEVHAAEPNLPVSTETLQHMIATGETSAAFRVGAIVFTAIGLIGLALAAVGVYSIVAYTISQHTREVGIRIALGAQKGDVVRVLLAASLKWIVAGLLGGAILGVMVSRVLTSQLLFQGEKLLDPAVILAVSLATGLLALVAAYLPARRAAGLAPAISLKFE